MRQIPSSIARTKLYELLADVERGETVVITRYGKPIARLKPDEKKRHRRRPLKPASPSDLIALT